jgi:hypothetical protein
MFRGNTRRCMIIEDDAQATWMCLNEWSLTEVWDLESTYVTSEIGLVRVKSSDQVPLLYPTLTFRISKPFKKQM